MVTGAASSREPEPTAQANQPRRVRPPRTVTIRLRPGAAVVARIRRGGLLGCVRARQFNQERAGAPGARVASGMAARAPTRHWTERQRYLTT